MEHPHHDKLRAERQRVQTEGHERDPRLDAVVAEPRARAVQCASSAQCANDDVPLSV